jgi:CheY-like chemotaxis protein
VKDAQVNGLSYCPQSCPTRLTCNLCPRGDSNARTRLRRAVLYPLSYGGQLAGRPSVEASSEAVRRSLLRTAAGNLPHVSGAGKVLVVDDDDVIRQLITVNLELEGFEVIPAVDGQDALDKVKDAKPDVVTLDVMMPRVDGWEAAARLREDPETAHIKVVLLSARAQESDIQRGERIGVDAYLTKPFDPDELIDVVRRLVDESGSASA